MQTADVSRARKEMEEKINKPESIQEKEDWRRENKTERK
jgi:hypothetical protein